MSVPAKKVAAIASVIYTCLGEEGQVQYAGPQVQTQQPRFQVNSPWALSGRQAMMDRQYHVQFRLNR
ncbi:MAG: hypothetical protein U5L00_18750 [Desulfovermiculus sp.]|nr:hypothetical protein [Desulfovermiculus sp.]